MPDDSFTRRVCAVLLADVSGFSALMGEDDERTARAVHRLQTLVQGIVAEAQGRAESVAGDAIFATFDSIVAAVDAALNIQRRIAAQEFEGTRLQVRIGVNFGDVLMREGSAFGDSINVAARLQTLAKPGTICMPQGVYRQVRNKFDEKFVDLGNQQLKNISDPVHVYLLVPREVAAEEPPPRRRSAVAWTIGVAALAAVAIVAIFTVQRHRSAVPERPKERLAGTRSAAGGGETQPAARMGVVATAPEEAHQVTLGVMVFKLRGGDAENEWMREALRDGLNTQLSGLSKVKVYAKEFLDFLVTRQGLSEIEVANKLGISKMLTGSFVAIGGNLQIETHVVDVATGVLESSYTTAGREEDFLDLQSDMVLEVIAGLELPVTPEEERLLLAKRATTVDALKLLLEAEGQSKAAPRSGDPPSTTEESRSALPSRQFAGGIFWRPAFAQEVSDEETAIVEVLEKYRQAMEVGEIEAVTSLYSDMSAERRAAQERYFDNVRDLQVKIGNVDVAVVGQEAVVSYTRTDDFIDRRTARPMHVAVRLTKLLRRGGDGWKFTSEE